MPDVAKLPSLFSGSATTNVDSFDDVVTMLSSNHYDGTSTYWWRIKASGEVLYGHFDNQSSSHNQRLRVLLFASHHPSRAARITNGEISSTRWIAPMPPPFTAPLGLSHIAREQLQRIKQLTNNIDIVLYRETYYLHKYMDYRSRPSWFEAEIMHYRRLHDTRLVRTIVSIVTHEGKNRGLLIEYIDDDPSNEQIKESFPDFQPSIHSHIDTCYLENMFKTVIEVEEVGRFTLSGWATVDHSSSIF